jgi:hypothetical protein
MTLYDFRALDEMEQQAAFWDGVHIGERADGDHWILLYQIDSFYVEVFYDKVKNVIVKYTAFQTTERLKPYLQQIDLKELLTERE